MSSCPLISCVCPTVGKTKHLEEAVQSFLMQTYPNKEMIIFNNYPRMDIAFEHPNVKVINYKGEINGIGDARNKGNEFTTGRYVCTWDDDDISLSDRLVNLYANLISWEHPRVVGVIGGALYSEGNIIKKCDTIFASNSLISKEFLDTTPYDSVDDDDHKMLAKLSKYNQGRFYVGEPTYIYRWATNTYHVSGFTTNVHNSRQRLLNWADSIGLPSQYQLTPYWERDYQKDADLFMESLSV